MKQSLLSKANTVTSDWKTELALGMISDTDKECLVEWMKYIRILKSIDTSNAPEIEWPKTPSP
ncbi:tail fiber assembly protein [Escherichia coli]|uniref:tail fiber assembly protein n=1 Tax=Escherichia coli TaxID=562 RepID=UPI001CBD1786